MDISKASRETIMASPVIKLGEAEDHFKEELFLKSGEFGVLQYDEHCYLGCCAFDGGATGEPSTFIIFRGGGSYPLHINAEGEQISVLKKVNVEISVTSVDETE